MFTHDENHARISISVVETTVAEPDRAASSSQVPEKGECDAVGK